MQTSPLLLLQDPDLVAEFLQKENEVCVKDIGFDLPTDFSFVMKNGAHAMNRRQIYAKFFYADRLREFTPLISATIAEVLDAVKANFGQ